MNLCHTREGPPQKLLSGYLSWEGRTHLKFFTLTLTFVSSVVNVLFLNRNNDYFNCRYIESLLYFHDNEGDVWVKSQTPSQVPFEIRHFFSNGV